MRAFLTGLGLVVLTACTETAPGLTSTEVFRNPSAQIASQTDVTAERMAGRWYVRQRFAGESLPSPFELQALPNGDLQMSVKVEVFTSDGGGIREMLHLFEATGPGRWTPVEPPRNFAQGDLWVMWMDFDSRTAAIGTPSGEFGWIMDKNATGGGDRIAAARDIMEWFGYNTAQLQEVN